MAIVTIAAFIISIFLFFKIIIAAFIDKYRLYVHVPTDPQWSKDVGNLSGIFLLVLNFCKIYNPSQHYVALYKSG